ncbi:MAG TPA: hypothetical protein VLN74_05410 [Ilumatobacteraceae bacterium]|nr:hypothetical protein [Ilumatobacteraceae bacterium]
MARWASGPTAAALHGFARTESVERLIVSFDSGLRDGKFNESLVHRRIVALRSSGRFGVPKLVAAIETKQHLQRDTEHLNDHRATDFA